MQQDKNLVYNDQELLNLLVERSAILKGHFVLSSGMHSSVYIQCAKLHEVPALCGRLCSLLLNKARKEFLNHELNVDVIASPAMGGIVFGYEIARQLGVNFVFFERVNRCFELRRGFSINVHDKVLIVEDVVTTGGSSMEIYNAITAHQGNVVGELSIINRSSEHNLPFPLISLLTLNIENYSEDNIPEELKTVPISKPGSKCLQ